METPTTKIGLPAAEVRHPDLLAIEALRTSEGKEDDRAHVRACPECAAILARFEAVAAGIRAAAPPVFAIPDDRDRAVLWIARKRARIARKQVRQAAWWQGLRPGPAWAAAAGVVVALAGVVALRSSELRRDLRTPPPVVALRGDVNGDGQVDILDAYRIALAIDAGHPAPVAWDLNGDGRIDHADVRHAAQLAVTLGEAAG